MYTDKFRDRAIGLVRAGQSQTAVAKKMKISANTLSKWLNNGKTTTKVTRPKVIRGTSKNATGMYEAFIAELEAKRDGLCREATSIARAIDVLRSL